MSFLSSSTDNCITIVEKSWSDTCKDPRFRRALSFALALAGTVMDLSPSCDSLSLEAFTVLCLLASACDEGFMIRRVHSLHSNHFQSHTGDGESHSSTQHRHSARCTVHGARCTDWSTAARAIKVGGCFLHPRKDYSPGGKTEPLCPSPPQDYAHTMSNTINSWIVTVDHRNQSL